MKSSVILIPALNPDENLVPYVKTLMAQEFQHIIIVNDGSSHEYDAVFTQLCELGCIVLNHAVNYGKGRALKNGFNEFLNRFGNKEKICGIITVDSDGQHLVEDVVKMDKILNDSSHEENLLLLGVRDFNLENVPFKSKFGNKVTCFFFRLLYGLKISDTQTGLRGITTECVKHFLALKGERFEYETSMLIAAVRKKIPIQEMTISTVYLENNSGTHFRPLQDSAIIYGILFGEFLKYALSSLSASIIDILLFSLLTAWIPNTAGIWVGTILARAISSFYNYTLNRTAVFASNGAIKKSLPRYYILCVIQGICSASLVSGFVALLGVPKVICKILVDTVLFFLSYRIQRKYVFIR